jgi:EAL domain-containing protein (putative c-di-GMP-specific phosphodiesterase class I)
MRPWLAGPVGRKSNSPAQLFAAAARCGMLAELDRRCLSASLSTAAAAGLRSLPAVINIEPIAGGPAHGLDRELADERLAAGTDSEKL